MDILSDIAFPDVAILANGAPPTDGALDLMRGARALVACDGAAEKAHALGRDVDFAVGDGDSLSEEMRASLGDRFMRVDEQETNDLAKAFRFSCDRFPDARTLVILGAHGLREDHLLGNISRLPEFAEKFARTPGRASDAFIAMVTDAGRFDVVMGRRTFRAKVGNPFSVFAFCAGTKVVSDGLEWPLEGVSLDILWKGTLNRAVNESVEICVDKPILVYRPFV